MPKPQPFLSKTKYLDGVKCAKLLWYEFNKTDAVPKPDPETQAIFDQGTLVGELAQKLYPDGINVGREQRPEETHAKTIAALKLRQPLFEAGLTYGRAYAIPDILLPVENAAWDLIEVKSGTSVEDVHLMDVAFQKYVYTGAGLKIRRCYLMHVDNQYLRKGEIEPNKLFKKDDITEEIEPHETGIEKRVDEMLAIIAGEEPVVKIGPQCNDPHACPLQDLCWGFLPKKSIFQLWSGREKKLFMFLERGIVKLTDIPEDELNDKQLIQIGSHRTGEPHVDREEIDEFLGELEYPLYFLDFETINPAIPVYDLTHPYEKVPFQYSLHVIPKEGSKPAHHAYLAPGDVDPRPEILKQLKGLLGSSGSIVAYSKSFEIGCLKKGAEAYPEFKGWVEKLEKRFVDLMGPFRALSYYHPKQEGKYSIKKVLPAMTDLSYDGLDIAEGGAASREYTRVTFGDNIDLRDRTKVRKDLEEYCQLDTQAMIEVLAGLKVL